MHIHGLSIVSKLNFHCTMDEKVLLSSLVAKNCVGDICDRSQPALDETEIYKLDERVTL